MSQINYSDRINPEGKIILPERRIHIPNHIKERLTNLAKISKDEADGILFYKIVPKTTIVPYDNLGGLYKEEVTSFDYFVEGVFMTGCGTSMHVRPLEDRVRVANKFLEKNKDYGFAKFHTHTEETCRVNSINAHYFSRGDKKGMDRQLKENPWFIELLFTPYSISAYGNPTLRVFISETNRDDILKEKELGDKINRMAHELGVDLKNNNLICHKQTYR